MTKRWYVEGLGESGVLGSGEPQWVWLCHYDSLEQAIKNLLDYRASDRHWDRKFTYRLVLREGPLATIAEIIPGEIINDT